MAEASAVQDGATTDVKVLSQLSGSDQTHTFTALSTTTTVGELKAKLAHTLASKPPADHQRLIYRGRLLARDAEPLSNVFGKDTSQPHILHLVVRETSHAHPHNHAHPPPAAPVPHAAPMAAAFAPVRTQHGAPAPTSAATAAPTPTVTAHTQTAPNAPVMPHTVHPQTPFDAVNAQNPVMRQPQVPAPFGFHPHMPAHQHVDFTAMFHGQPPATGPLPPGMPFGNPMLGDGRHAHFHPGHPAAAPAPQQAVGAAQVGSTDREQPARGVPGTTTNSSNTQSGHPPPAPQMSGSQAPSGANDPTSTAAESVPGAPPGTTGVRYGSGPNGEVITFAYTTSGSHPHPLPGHPPPMALPFPSPFGMRPPQGVGPPQQPPQLPLGLHASGHWNWNNMPPLGMGQEYFGVEHAVDSMRLYQNNLNNIHERVREHMSGQDPHPGLAAGFRAPVQSILRTRNRAQQLLNTLLLPGRYAHHDGLRAEDVSRLQELNAQFSTTVDTVLRDIERIQNGGQLHGRDRAVPPAQQSSAVSDSSRPATRSSTPSNSTPHRSVPVTAYLLNSPSGPQAVVYNAHGAFSSLSAPRQPEAARPDPVFSQLRSLASNPRLHRNPQERVDDRVARAREAVNSLNRELASANEALTAASSAVNNMHSTNAASARSTRHAERREAGATGGRAAEAPVHPPQAQAHVQRLQDQEFGNVLFQTLWHLWTVVRVFAFIWLFTRGMSTRRTVMLVIASVIYVAAQAGLFGSYLDRLRHHFEALLGLPPQQQEEPRHAAGAGDRRDDTGQDQNTQGGSAAADSNNGNRRQLPDPQTVADRLIRERRDRDRGWLSERLVPVERALALFLASLYPGVGERHIQARERQLAEQRRREEEAERATTEAAAQSPQEAAATVQAEDSAAEVTNVEPNPATGTHAEGSSTSAQVHEGSVRERASAGPASGDAATGDL